MCACVEPVGTAIGAMCVESGGRNSFIHYKLPGGRKWMLNHTHIQKNVLFFYFWHPMLVRPVMKRLFFLGKPRKKGSLRSRASWQKSYLSIVNPCIFCALGHNGDDEKRSSPLRGQLLSSIFPLLSLRCGPATCYDHGDGILDSEEVVFSSGSNFSLTQLATMSTNHSMGRVHSWRISTKSLKKNINQNKQNKKQNKTRQRKVSHIYICACWS